MLNAKMCVSRGARIVFAARVVTGPPCNGKVCPESPKLAQGHVLQRYYVLLLVIRAPKTKLLNQAVNCLTEAIHRATYSSPNRPEMCNEEPMPNMYKKIDSAVGPIKNESTRQRWEMFHRAIAHAKQSNDVAELETDRSTGDAESSEPFLSIVR